MIMMEGSNVYLYRESSRLERVPLLYFSFDLLSYGFFLHHKKELLFTSTTFFPIIICVNFKVLLLYFLFTNNVLTIS